MTGSGLHQAREAAEQGRWTVAIGLLEEAGVALRAGSDLDLFAWAALFAGEVERSIELRQRAFAAYLGDGDEPAAGYAALNVALNHFGRGMPTLGTGWLDQAERLLEAHGGSEEHAWLTWAKAVLVAEGMPRSTRHSLRPAP